MRISNSLDSLATCYVEVKYLVWKFETTRGTDLEYEMYFIDFEKINLGIYLTYFFFEVGIPHSELKVFISEVSTGC